MYAKKSSWGHMLATYRHFLRTHTIVDPYVRMTRNFSHSTLNIFGHQYSVKWYKYYLRLISRHHSDTLIDLEHPTFAPPCPKKQPKRQKSAFPAIFFLSLVRRDHQGRIFEHDCIEVVQVYFCISCPRFILFSDIFFSSVVLVQQIPYTLLSMFDQIFFTRFNLESWEATA